MEYQLVVDPTTGKCVVEGANVPTLDAIIHHPEKYPDYVLTMDERPVIYRLGRIF